MNPNDLIHQLRLELCRRVFWEFCLHYDEEFFSKRKFQEVIAEGFQKISDKEIKSLAISLPPRAGKSYITSLFCAWWIGNNPTLSVMRNSCTSRLFQKLSYDVRNIVKSDKFKEVFPTVTLSSDKQNVDGWNVTTAKQVSYFGAGVGGTIIGFGANLAISDDLYKGIAEAMSQTVNDSTHTWKQSSHNSRMEKDCPEIYIGTRWTKNDIIGSAIEKGNVDLVINVPALNEEGESFCEDVKSTAEYLKIKEDTDEMIWEAEYQQNPVELKGLLFPISSLRMYNPSEFNPQENAEYQFAYVDPADDGGDSLASPFASLIGDKIYIHDLIYSTDGTDATIPRIVNNIIKYKVNAAEIEGNGGWVMFGKDIRRKVTMPSPIGEGYGDCQIRVINSSTNKHTRIVESSAFILNRFVFRSDWENIPEYRKFIKNLTTYMRVQEGMTKNKHDDAPDSCTGIALHFRKRFTHIF